MHSHSSVAPTGTTPVVRTTLRAPWIGGGLSQTMRETPQLSCIWLDTFAHSACGAHRCGRSPGTFPLPPADRAVGQPHAAHSPAKGTRSSGRSVRYPVVRAPGTTHYWQGGLLLLILVPPIVAVLPQARTAVVFLASAGAVRPALGANPKQDAPYSRDDRPTWRRLRCEMRGYCTIVNICGETFGWTA